MTYMDGYVFYIPPGRTNQVNAVEIDDATNHNALAVTTFNARADLNQAVIANRRDLWVIGEKSAEIWYNAGNTNFPFSRRDSIHVERGTLSPKTVKVIDTTLMWLDENGQVIVITQYQPKVVSTEPMHHEIRNYERIDDAKAHVFVENGQYFYEITFPAAEMTWVFSLNTGLWHKRLYWDAANAQFTRNRACANFTLGNRLFLADYENGKIYLSTPESFTDAGDMIRYERVSSHLHSHFLKLGIACLELKVETGVGLASGQGANPQIMLQISKDRGHTWGSEKWKTLGTIGNYLQRGRWYR